MKVDRTDSDTPFFCQWYSCIIDRDISDFHIQESEVQDIRWWGREELRKAIQETPELFTKTMPKYFEMFENG